MSQGKEVKNGRSVGSTGDGIRVGRESYHRCSVAELRMILGYWIWGNRRRREDLQAVFLVFWQAWLEGWQGCLLGLGASIK